MRHTTVATSDELKKQDFVHSRIDEGIKKKASLILNKLGLNVSDAIRLFLNQVVITKSIPFPVCIPNAETLAAMEEAERGEGLEEVTLDQLRAQFQKERKKLIKNKEKK